LKTNDWAHKDGNKNRWFPSLKLIYVTIIFNNAKKGKNPHHCWMEVATAACSGFSLLFLLHPFVELNEG